MGMALVFVGILVFIAALIISGQHETPKPFAPWAVAAPVPVATPVAIAPTPAPAPAVVAAAPTPAPFVPRAEPVLGPLTAEGVPMIAGRQYYVTLPEPDGRHILVNYKGWIPHACMLPRQHGVTNSMFTDEATGVNWIWTIPVSGSTVPRWIDP
jgi:hypothetical protein